MGGWVLRWVDPFPPGVFPNKVHGWPSGGRKRVYGLGPPRGAAAAELLGAPHCPAHYRTVTLFPFPLFGHTSHVDCERCSDLGLPPTQLSCTPQI